MEVKLIEIRDSATFIPAMAIRLSARASDPEMYLFRRAGYSLEQLSLLPDYEPYVILLKLDGVEANYDPYSWNRGRTMSLAHSYIIHHWSKIQSGDVVDVQFILGETQEPKVSERA